MRIDPSSAARKAITVILCIFVCVGIIAWAVISHAFTFKIQNNLDQPVEYSLFRISEWDRAPAPLFVSEGMLDGGTNKMIDGTFYVGEYKILWTEPGDGWKSEAEFEIPSNITDGQEVEVSIDFVPMKITVLKPGN